MTKVDVFHEQEVSIPHEKKSPMKISCIEFRDDLGIQQMDHDDKNPTGENSKLLYGIEETPSFPTLLCLAMQICIGKIPGLATATFLLNDAICGDSVVAAKLLSTMIFLVGLTTLLQCTIGVRLPVFQGPALAFITALLSRAQLPDWQCTLNTGTRNQTLDIIREDESTVKLQEAAGSLMVATGVHVLLGLTGVVGFLTRFIGPATIVPAMLLLSLELAVLYQGFAEIHWGVTIFTCAVVVLFSSYLGHLRTPVPAWNRKRGWHIIRPQLVRPFAILLGMSAGWLLCFILTASGRLSSDPQDLEFEARTDKVAELVEGADWFYAPYPGQFGPPRLDIGLVFSYLVAMFVSVLDSIADYYATSKVCNVSDPPPHAINRGLFVEGVCSVLSGAFGAAHATTTYTSVIGDMALTGVTSRRVFQVSSLMIMFLAFIGKFVAVFLSVPKPVMGGFTMVSVTTLIGVILSSLNEINMEKPRNVVAVGFPIFFGYMLTKWVVANPTSIDVGIPELNQLFQSVLGNSIFVAGFLGCFLDNTLPGKQHVRPQGTSEDGASGEADEVYELPYISGFLRRQTWTKYVPIFPGFVARKTTNNVN